MTGRGGMLVLAEGEAPLETIIVFPSATYVRRYFLEGYERIAWSCRVLDDFDVGFSTRVSCAGLQRGVDRSREVTERERGCEFSGFLDLGKEHQSWLSELGAASGLSAASGGVRECSPMLTLEFDNSYSYFTAKKVELCLCKIGGVAPKVKSYTDAIASCEAGAQWERALQLLDRMADVGIGADIEVYHAAMVVCRAGGSWEKTLDLLDKMRKGGIEPDASSYNIAISECEKEGQAGRALQLLGEMSTAESGEVNPLFGRQGDIQWLDWMLGEALARCPKGAHKLQRDLAAARASFERYAEAEQDSRDCSSAPFPMLDWANVGRP